jgi:multiple sugar transport system substrate-binding protein
MKKVLALTLALCMVFSLCACGGSTGSTTTTTTTTTAAETTEDTAVEAGFYDVTEPITITWWHALEDQYTDLVNEVVDDFNNSQDLITVKAEYIGKYSEVNEALAAAVAANSGLPGVVVANTDYVAQYGASGVFEDLTPYIAATDYDVDDFSTGLLLSSQYDGKQIALPFLHSTQVIYYNKTIADEYGIEVPTTIDGLEDFVKAGAEACGMGLAIPGWDQWYFETLYLNEGVDIITDDNTCDLNSDTAIGVTSMLKDMCDEGIAYFAVGTEASGDMRQSFYDQNLFAALHTSSLYNNYVNNCDFEVGMAWYPAASTGDSYSEVGGCVLGIPAGNDQATKNAAWVFLQYLCGKEVNMKWAEGTGYLPTRNSVLTTDEGVAFLEAKPAFQCIFDNLNLINPRIQNSAWSQLATTWKNYMDVMLNQGGDIASQSELMVEEINEILEDA